MLLDMSQIPLWGGEARVWAVGDLTRYLRELLESDYRLQDVWVSGEVSSLSRPASGHIYFNLKDPQASLRCVMWRSDAARQTYLPRAGEAIEAHGHLSVYEAGGQYQLYADELRPAGEGVLFQEFLRLKARLEADGLFAPERKRALPAWPSRIGVVTSPSGAALRDVLHVLRRRFPLAEVILAPTPVQGGEAADGIVRALTAINQISHPDVILLVRGGGSLEDLWAFNEEAVVRAVAGSLAPVVTGVGHETDFSLADFAADLRAPTPSAAAELATPDRLELAQALRRARLGLASGLGRQLEQKRWQVTDRRAALQRLSPTARLANARQRLDELTRLAQARLRHRLALGRAEVRGLQQALRAVDPLAVLGRGYAVVRRRDDQRLVRSCRDVTVGDGVEISVSDGAFPAQVVAGPGGTDRSAAG
jgi:exodeoxyribonuclease VII large subunit